MREIRLQAPSGFLVCAYLAAMLGILLLVVLMYFGLVPATPWGE